MIPILVVFVVKIRHHLFMQLQSSGEKTTLWQAAFRWAKKRRKASLYELNHFVSLIFQVLLYSWMVYAVCVMSSTMWFHEFFSLLIEMIILSHRKRNFENVLYIFFFLNISGVALLLNGLRSLRHVVYDVMSDVLTYIDFNTSDLILPKLELRYVFCLPTVRAPL